MWYGDCTMNQQLTISIITDLRSRCRQLVQHRPSIAYGLRIFIGSGLTTWIWVDEQSQHPPPSANILSFQVGTTTGARLPE